MYISPTFQLLSQTAVNVNNLVLSATFALPVKFSNQSLLPVWTPKASYYFSLSLFPVGMAF